MSDQIKTSAEALEAEALPKHYEAHSNPDAETDFPDMIAEKPMAQKSAAAWAYERLILYIQNFEKQLDNEHEVAMGFAGGDVGVLRIEAEQDKQRHDEGHHRGGHGQPLGVALRGVVIPPQEQRQNGCCDRRNEGGDGKKVIHVSSSQRW